VQRVVRAQVEVDGFVTSRVGSGLMLSLGIQKGDTEVQAQELATKVLKLLIFPEVGNPEQQYATSVIDNGFEVLVLSQQSLLAEFKGSKPNSQAAMDDTDAKVVYEAFTKALQDEYQSEMVITTVFGDDMRVEAMHDGPHMIELRTDAGVSGPPRTAFAPQLGQTKALEVLQPDISSVTDALMKLPMLKGPKATLESCRIFRVFSTKKFQASLADAISIETDAFAEALEKASGRFNQKQRDQINAWTGLSIDAPLADQEAEAEDAEEDFEDQMAMLRGEARPQRSNKRPATNAMGVKSEYAEWYGDASAKRHRAPDSTARAAPDTPGSSARDWAANRAHAWGAQGRYQPTPPASGPSQDQLNAIAKGKGKGKKGGKGKNTDMWGPRKGGIATTDILTGADYRPGSDGNVRLVKEEAADGDNRPTPALRRPRGMPTLAPMTPAV